MEKLSDEVILIAGDEEILCTRSSLAAASPYFQAMFNSEMKEKNSAQVRLHDVIPDILRVLVDFAENKKLSLTQNNASELLRAACLFQFEVVRDACCRMLVSSLDVQNCLTLWGLADTLGVEEIRRRSKRLALWEGQTILQSELLLELPKCLFKELISNTGLRTDSEMGVFQALVSWCARNESRSGELIPFIRTSMLSQTERNSVEKYNSNQNVMSAERQLVPPRKTPYVTLLVGTKERDDQGKRRTTKDIHFFICIDSNLVTKELTIFQLKWVNLQALLGYGTCVVGKDIYIFGGKQAIESGGWNTETWKYDSFTEKWQTVAPMLCERRHFVYAVCDGKIYVAGGFGKFRVVLTSCDIYDPRTDTWEECCSIPCPSFSACLVSHKNRLYFFCNAVFRYDPGKDLWECVRRDPTFKGVGCGVSLGQEIYLWDKQDRKLTAYDPDSDAVGAVATIGVETVGCLSVLEQKLLVHGEEGILMLDSGGEVVNLVKKEIVSDFVVERSDRIPWYQLL